MLVLGKLCKISLRKKKKTSVSKVSWKINLLMTHHGKRNLNLPKITGSQCSLKTSKNFTKSFNSKRTNQYNQQVWKSYWKYLAGLNFQWKTFQLSLTLTWLLTKNLSPCPRISYDLAPSGPLVGTWWQLPNSLYKWQIW